MLIKAIMSLRNHKVIEARKQLGFSQNQLAIACDVSINAISEIECLRLKRVNTMSETTQKVANFLGLDVEDVAPASLCGVEFSSKFESVQEVTTHALMLYGTSRQEQQILPSPSETMEHEELTDYFMDILKHNMHRLSSDQSEVINLLYGLDGGDTMSYAQAGRKLNRTREAIRMREQKALQKLHHVIEAETRLSDTKTY